MSRAVSFFVSGLLLGVLLAGFGFVAYVNQSAGLSAGEGQTVLKLGHSLDTGHPVHVAMEFMGDRLAELSGGAVRLDIYPSGVLGSEVQCIEQLQVGSLAITKTSAASMENFISVMSVYGLPYLFRDVEHYWEVLSGPIGMDLLRRGEHKFLRGLCYYDSGSRNFYTTDSPVRSPADLAGLKIRVMNSKTAIDMVKAMGGAPTPIAWGELYSALAQGAVDGAENNLPSFTSNRHYEMCKHFTLDHHTRIPDIVMISTKVWERLSPQVRQWVQQAADESAVFQRALWAEKSAEALALAKQEGVQIYSVDMELFAQQVKPMYEEIESPEVRRLVEQISAVGLSE